MIKKGIGTTKEFTFDKSKGWRKTEAGCSNHFRRDRLLCILPKSFDSKKIHSLKYWGITLVNKLCMVLRVWERFCDFAEMIGNFLG